MDKQRLRKAIYDIVSQPVGEKYFNPISQHLPFAEYITDRIVLLDYEMLAGAIENELVERRAAELVTREKLGLEALYIDLADPKINLVVRILSDCLIELECNSNRQ